MSTKLVIFDCDGVLVDSETLQAQSYSDVLKPLGVDLDPTAASKKFAGLSLDGTVDAIRSEFKIRLPENFAEMYRERMKEIFATDLVAIEGIHDLLNELTLPKCVASNGPQEKMKYTLEITGLSEFFSSENIFSAYDIDCFKPDPGLYLYAAKKMGFSPSECIVLEDSLPGVQAAIAAGTKAVFFNRDGNFDSVASLNVHACISHTSDFLELMTY